LLEYIAFRLNYPCSQIQLFIEDKVVRSGDVEVNTLKNHTGPITPSNIHIFSEQYKSKVLKDYVESDGKVLTIRYLLLDEPLRLFEKKEKVTIFYRTWYTESLGMQTFYLDVRDSIVRVDELFKAVRKTMNKNKGRLLRFGPFKDLEEKVRRIKRMRDESGLGNSQSSAPPIASSSSSPEEPPVKTSQNLLTVEDVDYSVVPLRLVLYKTTFFKCVIIDKNDFHYQNFFANPVVVEVFICV
jgi:hypothetical protein